MNLRLIWLSLALIGINSPVLAQIRGGSSTEFFQRGQQQINTEIQRMEDQRRQEENNLEQTLDINKPQGTTVEETPSNPESLQNNVPESPEQEIDVKPE